MLELWEIVQRLLHEPLQAGTLVACALFIIDRLFKRAFIRHARKFLHLKSREDVELHMERLNAIDKKLEILLKERGIEWSDHNVQGLKSVSKHSAWRNAGRLWQLPKTSSAANFAQVTTKFSGRRRRNMPTNKLIYLPIVVQLCVIIKELWGIDIGTDQQNAIAVIVAAVVGIIGAWMEKHKKEELSDQEKHYL